MEEQRAALYVRVSTEEQARTGISLEAQQDTLRRYANENGLKIVGYYCDPGISARKSYKRRPALMRLLGDVQAGKIDTILFIKLDRWFRNLESYYEVQHILDTHNVTWRATEEDYETVTASGRFKVNIMLSVAQDEADRTSERIKFVYEQKKAKGEAITGSTPKGYMLAGEKGHRTLVKDPSTEKAVEAFIYKYLACGSMMEAIREAERMGLKLRYPTADNILRNTAYYGTYWGVDGMTPPYITKDEYDRIQAMRRRIVRDSTQHRVYYFSGIIYCGNCGRRFNGGYAKASNCMFYNCSSYGLAETSCGKRISISQRKIEKHLLETLESKIVSYELNATKTCEKERKSNANAIAKAKKRMAKLKELYLEDLMELEEYKAERAALEKSIEEMEIAEKEFIPADLSNLKNILSHGWKEQYKDLSDEKKREFWLIAIKRIVINPDRSISYDLNV